MTLHYSWVDLWVFLYIYIVEMWERTTCSKCNPAHQNRWTQELCRRLALHWKFQFLQSSTEVWKFGPPHSQSSITLCKTMQYLVPTVVGCPRGTKTTRYWHLWVTVHQFLRRLIDLETQEAHTHTPYFFLHIRWLRSFCHHLSHPSMRCQSTTNEIEPAVAEENNNTHKPKQIQTQTRTHTNRQTKTHY